ncbi:antiterminator Q family protein [uncultured Gilvimarinus sp.]|uniref:antiterminator Q family protein n=1 Tax=uncultured Gilvimarinus sp. TaxID=1689143 RepID=UPI0030DBE5D4
MEHTKLLLAEWGKWARQWGFNLGYPSASAGFGGVGGHAETVLYSDDVMECVGRAVHALRKVDAELYELINDYFKSKLSERMLATKYRVSRRQVRSLLASAVVKVDRELGALAQAA